MNENLIKNKTSIQLALVCLTILSLWLLAKYSIDTDNVVIIILTKVLFYTLLLTLITFRIWIKHTLYQNHFKHKIKKTLFIFSSLVSALIFGFWWYGCWNIWHYWKDHDLKTLNIIFYSYFFWGRC
jgi:hypothetical protein